MALNFLTRGEDTRATPQTAGNRPLVARFRVTPEKIQRRLEFYQVGPAERAAMKEIHGIIDPAAEGIVDAFYAHVGRFIALTRLIHAHSSVERLKQTLRGFIVDIGLDMSSLDYVERRLQVGATHSRIGLQPRWYLGAYAFLQSEIRQVLSEACNGDTGRYKRLTEALEKVLMFDVSLGIDAYHQDTVAKLEASVEALRETEAALRETARLDGLTGILGHKALMEALQQEVDRSRRYDHPMAVMFIDFDNFKSINDSHGHQFGDHVLLEATRCIRETIRTPDILGRYGGEELMVVLVECSPEDAVRIAERVRRTIAGHAIEKRRTGVLVPVTVSIGLHGRASDQNDASILVRCADRALYAAKKAGRNRVVVYGPELGI